MFKPLPLFFCVLLASIEICAQPSENIEELYSAGIKLKNSGKYTESLTAFREAIDKNPDDADALFEAGWTYNELKQYDSAIIYLQTAKQREPSASVFFELAYAYEKLDKKDEAKENYGKALELFPKYHDADKHLGDIFYSEENYSTALNYFKKYFDENRAPESYYFYKAARCSNATKDYSDALLYLEKYEPHGQKDFSKKYTEIGYAYYMMGYNDNAINAYQNALDANDDCGDALRGMADVYFNNLQDYNKALQYFSLALQKDEANSKDCYYKVGWIYLQQQKYSEAATVLQKATDYDAKDKSSREALGYSFFMLNKFDDAIYQFDLAIETNPRSELSYYYKGLCYANLNQKENAMSAYLQLKSINKEGAQKLLKEIKQKEKAIKAAESAQNKMHQTALVNNNK
jgi:tetratricopeptide (TPR) repeat protein